MSIINLNPDVVPNQEVKDEVIEDVQEQSTELKEEPIDQPTTAKSIVMDGPLSKIYTQALNIAYAKEAASASGQTETTLIFNEEEQKAQDEVDHHSLYVYCCDADELQGSDVIDGSDKLRLALDSKKYRGALVVMESHGSVSRHAGLLEEYASKNGVRVIFNRANALEVIKTM